MDEVFYVMVQLRPQPEQFVFLLGGGYNPISVDARTQHADLCFEELKPGVVHRREPVSEEGQ